MPYLEHSMSITPDDLRQVRFAQARKGGYETEAVDRALDTVADSIDVMIQERAQLIERVRVLEGELDRLKAEGPSGQPLPAVAGGAQDSTMVELLGETRAIRSLLQAIVTQGGGRTGAPPAS